MDAKEKVQQTKLQTASSIKMESAMSSVTSMGSAMTRSTTGVTGGICRDELLTNKGKKIQLIKMLCLTTLPNLVLWTFTLYILTEAVKEKSAKEITRQDLKFSVELGRAIHQLQRERDMSILYLSALGPETKTFLLTEYIATDNSINQLSTWPVNFDTARSPAFATKENFLQHLSSHRQSLDKNNYDIYMELDFYNYVIDSVLSWLVQNVGKGMYATVWKTIVAYLKITNGKQDVGVERALGTYFFVKGGFYDQDKFQLYNRRVHKFQAFYYTAQMYSDQVYGLYKEGYLSAGYNVTAIVNLFRYEIQNSMDAKIQPDIKKAQIWFDNMTVYMDALYGIQKELGEVVLHKLNDEINALEYTLAISISFIVLVVIVFPIVIISTESLTSSIQRYALTLVNKTKELSKEKKRTDSLLYQMVPKPVADKLKKRMNIEAEFFKMATVFFSDIYQFSRITADCNPIEVVEVLNKLYVFIDERLDSYDVYKVETINDSYMVASGLPNRNKDRHAVEIANLSIDLLKMLKTKPVVIGGQKALQLRIGINTGPCMAGIVGTALPRYCLFGDTINVASRMKSYSQPNRIHISDTTYYSLRKYGSYITKKRGHIDVKGKGAMVTYWLLGKQSDSRLKLDVEADGTMDSLGELPGEISQFHSQDNIRSVLNFPIPGRKVKGKVKTSTSIEMKNIDDDQKFSKNDQPKQQVASKVQTTVEEDSSDIPSNVTPAPSMNNPAEKQLNKNVSPEKDLAKKESTDEDSLPVKTSPSLIPKETNPPLNPTEYS